MKLQRLNWGFGILAAAEAFALAALLLWGPAAPPQWLVSGYSYQSRIGAGLLAACGLGALAAAWAAHRKTARLADAVQTDAAQWTLGLLFSAAFSALLLRQAVPPAAASLYARLLPLAAWLALISFEALVVTGLLRKKPRVARDRLTYPLGLLFALLILANLPPLWNYAAEADAQMQAQVYMNGDDAGYNNLAVNWLHGYGYTSSVLLPAQSYHLDPARAISTDQPRYTFIRPPGFPLLLSAAYRIFGTETLVARRLLAVLLWLAGAALFLTGTVLAGAPGVLAGGLTALYTYQYAPMGDLTRILTEIPAAFWIAALGLCFTIYRRRGSLGWLIAAALCLLGSILTRLNFVVVLPLLAGYLVWKGAPRRDWIVLSAVVLLPMIVWSIYASQMLGRPTWMSTQAGDLFAETNNELTLEGIGPQRSNQGGWNPRPVADEFGWQEGLHFWQTHWRDLPRLFFVKLRLGFWYNNGRPLNVWQPERLYLTGIGFLLFALGLRAKRGWLPEHTALGLQAVLLAALLLGGNQVGFGWVLAFWLAILVIAVSSPYGQIYKLPYETTAWVSFFVFSHLITTVLFYGVRFHWPVDGPLMLAALLGLWQAAALGAQKLAEYLDRLTISR